MSHTKAAIVEDDGFITIHCTGCDDEGVVWTNPPDPQDAVEVPCHECRPTEVTCLRCGDTGYRRDWRGTKVMCDDCGPDQ